MVLNLMLAFENCINSPPHDHQVWVQSLDAMKCFDLIRVDHALEALKHMGVCSDIRRALATFWTTSNRHIAAFGQIDPERIPASRGIPQGCALSVLTCNAMVAGWAARVASLAQPAAYIDDRYLMTSNSTQLQHASDLGQSWERDSGWRCNIEKSVVASYPPANIPIVIDSKEFPRVDTLSILGTQIPLSAQAKVDIHDDRQEKAQRCLDRVGVLRLPLHLTQTLVETVILPKFTYHIQARPVPRKLCENMRRSIQQIIRTDSKGHAWECLAVLVRKPHRFDPESSAIYAHIVSVCRALRCKGPALPRWHQALAIHQPKRPRGPRGVWILYLQRLDLREEEGILTHRPTGESIDMFKCDWGKFTHYVRSILRYRLLKRVADRRKNLEGAEQCDVKVTVALLRRKLLPNRALLIQALCDTIWSQERRASIGWTPSPNCEFCGCDREDARHILHDCPAWALYRTWPDDVARQIDEMPKAAQRCLLCPLTASERVKRQWSTYQQACVRILVARSNHIKKGPEVSRGPAPLVPAPKQTLHFAACIKPLSQLIAMPFTLPAKLRQGKCQWNWSRDQWHRLSHYMGTLRVEDPSIEPVAPHPTTLELYLSYLVSNGGHRFTTQVCANRHGEWVSNQLEGFLLAVRCFIGLTGMVDFLPVKGGPRSSRGCRYVACALYTPTGRKSTTFYTRVQTSPLDLKGRTCPRGLRFGEDGTQDWLIVR